MTKEEILQKIKDDYAKERGYEDFNKMMWINDGKITEDQLEDIANRFAIDMCEEQKKSCGESARSICDNYSGIIHVDKQSILEAKNVAE